MRLPAYQISKYEVANAQYAAFVQATGRVQDKSWEKYARLSGKQAAVVSVSWLDAQAYCDCAGLRSPTERTVRSPACTSTDCCSELPSALVP